MTSFLGKPPSQIQLSPKKRQDMEKKFSQEILRSCNALDNAYQHSFDDVGKTLAELSRRPADRMLLWRGTLLVLELKATDDPTLPYSAFKRGKDHPWHQVETLCAVTRAGGHGVALVKQGRRCWVLPAQALAVCLEGRPGSFLLGPPLREVARVPHPRGHEGLVWDLPSLFEDLKKGLNFSQGGGS